MRESKEKTVLRVLQVVTHMNRGGLESMLMNYYRHIDREVIQFDFLTHRPYDGDFGEEILRMGGKIYHLPALNPFSVSYKKALDQFFSEHSYDIVHSHLDCMSAYPLYAAKKAGVKVRIAHAHNTSQDKNLKYILKMSAKKKIPKEATDLFACGKEAGEWMFDGNPFQIMNNAIDANAYRYNPKIRKHIREQYQLGDAFVLGHVGRFNPQKNHAFLINVFAEVVKQNSNVRLVLVGGGIGEDELRRRVEELGIEKHVIFAGVCSNVNELLQAMDVFVFPSLYEGFPVTMVEAQAAGLPCVMSDNVPQESKLTDLVTSLSLETDKKQWAETVLDKKQIKRADYFEQIRAAGYDIKANAQWLTDFYQKALQRG